MPFFKRKGTRKYLTIFITEQLKLDLFTVKIKKMRLPIT